MTTAEKIEQSNAARAKLELTVQPIDHATIEEHLDKLILMGEITEEPHYHYARILFYQFAGRKDEIPQFF